MPPKPHTIARETRDARYDHLMIGEVVDRDDPLGLGRVRVFVPGLLEPRSAWALPIGRMLGVRSGFHAVPELGANVFVWLNHGDVDHPCYLPGPFGAPKGESDVPEQAPGGSVDHLVLRWRGFHLTMDGTEGAGRLTIEDLVTGTRLDLDRTTGDFTRQVTGSERATIQQDLQETVVTGQEQHTVAAGGRTTSIALADARTIGTNESATIGGSRQETIAGSEEKVVGLTSTELVGLSKVLAAGLNVAIAAGGLVSIVAGGAITMLGAATTIQSAGPSSNVAAGLQTSTFLGGILETVVGTVTKTVDGAWSLAATGAASILSGDVRLGTGPFRRLLSVDYHGTVVAPHVHPYTSPTGPALSGVGQVAGVPFTPTPPPATATEHLTAS